MLQITSAGLWLLNGSGSNVTDVLGVETATTTVEVANVDEDELTFSAANFWLNWIGSNAWKSNLAFKFRKPDSKLLDQVESSGNSQSSKSVADDAVIKINEEELHNFPLSAKETFKAAIVHCGKKWCKRLSFIWRCIIQIFGSFQQIWVGIINISLECLIKIFHKTSFSLHPTLAIFFFPFIFAFTSTEII